MRLKPGITLAYADNMLRRCETEWSNARGAQDYFAAYTVAVHNTGPMLRRIFAEPDLAAGMYTPAYWNLLQIGDRRTAVSFTNDPDIARGWANALRAQNNALAGEIEVQVHALELVRSQFDALKELASRPGLPIVYDTNMLNHWQQPGDVRWRELFRERGEVVPLARLVVPLRVIDELDRQKYGSGDLAKKAATAIRYLDRVLADSPAGEPVELRTGESTLEVWLDTDDRSSDADLAILRCAADLANLHPGTGARVLTDDVGMRLRAGQLNLPVVRLPAAYRKKGTAMD
jgi:hypothetical protein